MNWRVTLLSLASVSACASTSLGDTFMLMLHDFVLDGCQRAVQVQSRRLCHDEFLATASRMSCHSMHNLSGMFRWDSLRYMRRAITIVPPPAAAFPFPNIPPSGGSR